MKYLAAFVLGGLLATGIAYFLVRSYQEPPAVAPEAAVPAAAEPTAAPEPAPPPPTARIRKTTPVPAREQAKAPPPPEPLPPEPAPQPPAPEQPKATVQQPVPLTPPKETPSTPPPPAPRTPRTATLAEGTLVTVRLMERVSSDVQQAGDAFSATLDQPIVVDGYVIAERGSRVEGRVAQADRAGRVRGVAHLALELVQITSSDGQKVAIRTAAFEKEGEKSTNKDAAKIGAGAAIGAAIGAIAGGGKGAAIGAAAGGAAGTGTVLATRGQAAELATETRLSFRLAEPVTITERLR